MVLEHASSVSQIHDQVSSVVPWLLCVKLAPLLQMAVVVEMQMAVDAANLFQLPLHLNPHQACRVQTRTRHYLHIRRSTKLLMS
jgi:hypothetical protein